MGVGLQVGLARMHLQACSRTHVRMHVRTQARGRAPASSRRRSPARQCGPSTSCSVSHHVPRICVGQPSTRRGTHETDSTRI